MPRWPRVGTQHLSKIRKLFVASDIEYPGIVTGSGCIACNTVRYNWACSRSLGKRSNNMNGNRTMLGRYPKLPASPRPRHPHSDRHLTYRVALTIRRDGVEMPDGSQGGVPATSIIDRTHEFTTHCVTQLRIHLSGISVDRQPVSIQVRQRRTLSPTAAGMPSARATMAAKRAEPLR